MNSLTPVHGSTELAEVSTGHESNRQEQVRIMSPNLSRTEQASHDLAAARLGELGGEKDLRRSRDRADFPYTLTLPDQGGGNFIHSSWCL